MLIFGIVIFMFVIRKPGGQIKHLLISYLSNAIFKVDFIKKFFYPREKERYYSFSGVNFVYNSFKHDRTSCKNNF
jgi:hypothetical protein